MHVTVKDVKWPKTLFDDTEPRQPGLHLSDIIRRLEHRIAPSRNPAKFKDLELAAEIGLLWEDVLSRAMGDKYADRPPQIQEDGIWMSLDGIGPDPEDKVPFVVEEYKAAWKSTKWSPQDIFKYMVQVQSYCRAVGTNTAIMRIFHVMGDYKGSGPIYRVARLVFTPRELQENWDMVLRERDRMVEEGVI